MVSAFLNRIYVGILYYLCFAGKINFHAHALKGEELHFPHWHTPLSGSLMMSVLCSGDKLNEAGVLTGTQ